MFNHKRESGNALSGVERSPSLMKSLLLLAFAIFNFSSFAHARDLAVVVWVDDWVAFDRKAYENDIKHISERNPDLEVETLYLSKFRKEHFHRELQEFVDTHLRPEDRVRVLVLATHGNTDFKSNKTSLQDLGTFGATGVDGFLKIVLEKLGPYYSDELNLLLESCSTYCGSQESIAARTRGLFSFLETYSVKVLRVWGATQTMLTSKFNRQSFIKFLGDLNWKVMKFYVPLSAIAFTYFQSTEPVMPLIAFLGLINGVSSVNYFFAGTAGVEVQMNPDSQVVRPRDYYDPRMFLPTPLSCSEVFGFAGTHESI